jgi:sugar diacid utilization regulator
MRDEEEDGHVEQEVGALSAVLERPARPDAAFAEAAKEGSSEVRLRSAVASFTEVAGMLGRGTSTDDLLHAVAREISALVGVERCSIHLLDEATGRFRGQVGTCAGAPLGPEIKRSMAGGAADGMTRELLETRRPVVAASAPDDPRTVKSTVRFWHIRSIMAVPMIFAGEVVGVIFLDEANRPHRFTEADGDVAMVFAGLAAVAVMHAKDHTDLRAQLEASNRHVKCLRRATAVDEQLSELVLDGRPLQHLLDTLAELLGKPCAVFDDAGHRLVAAAPPGSDDGITPRLLEPEIAGRPPVRDALVEHEGSRAFVVGPLPAAGVLHRHVVAPISGAGGRWGHLVVMEHKTRFTGADMVTLRRAATLMALQVSTERRALEAHADARSSLVADLLGGSPDDNAVRRRAEHLGVRLDVPRAVLVVGSRDGTRGLPDFRAVASAWRRVAPGVESSVVRVGDDVALLTDVPEAVDEAAFVAEQRSALEALLSDLPRSSRLVAGVSNVHGGRDGYRVGFEEARQVVECIRRFSPPGEPRVRSADELGSGRLFLATSDIDLVAGFAEETFGDMVRDETKAELLATLCLFFEHMASIRRTAAHLGMHENTIRYRLSRIEELTGLALTHDPDSQLRARLSLLVLQLQGRLPVPEAAVGEAVAPTPALEVVRSAAS